MVVTQWFTASFLSAFLHTAGFVKGPKVLLLRGVFSALLSTGSNDADILTSGLSPTGDFFRFNEKAKQLRNIRI
ncbi:hypothetical protein C7974DRAFT_385586 [Boeremia exigua]|uniref:uncharacterized protein n=1 Tax=Boeremia exigua TaxID=749465 RepID=UPI001E8CA110|nr:uncharacterized protein C7974DRAFT_385586 [Boeremia exigua]KAH6642518.1 hypothetical protein C7974DRAFT_385586 [Boeremia exigua]